MSEKNIDFKKKIAAVREKLAPLERNAKVTLLALGATALFGNNKINAAERTGDNTPSSHVTVVTDKQASADTKSTIQYAGEVVSCTRYENGNVKYERYSSGASRLYYESGKLMLESQFGVSRKYYENKNLKSVSLPDGTKQEYYENGNLKEEELPFGTRYYNKDGSLEKTEYAEEATIKILSDGSREITYKDYLAHQRRCVEHPDGSWQDYDTFFNKLETERTADGTHRIYYGGKLSFEYTADGTATNYDANGNVESQYVFSHTATSTVTPTITSTRSQGR